MFSPYSKCLYWSTCCSISLYYDIFWGHHWQAITTFYQDGFFCFEEKKKKKSSHSQVTTCLIGLLLGLLVLVSCLLRYRHQNRIYWDKCLSEGNKKSIYRGKLEEIADIGRVWPWMKWRHKRLGESLLDVHSVRNIWQIYRGAFKPKMSLRGVPCLPGVGMPHHFCAVQSPVRISPREAWPFPKCSRGFQSSHSSILVHYTL